MRLFGWFRRAPREEQDARQSPRRWAWIGGRRVLAASPYVMPKDKVEGDRLDLQHHLYKLMLGRNYYPRLRAPRAILDVACGTGIWGREMALEFKRAQITGFDIDRKPMEASLARLGPTGQFPPNFTFLEADALQRFPFVDQQFDFTHARAISPFVPITRWPDVVAEMVRVTKRGGYVELVDFEMMDKTPSPAFNTLWDALKHLMEARGLHTGAASNLAHYLRQAGLTQVQERRIIVGTGKQADRQRRLLVTDLLSIVANVQPIIVRAGILSEAAFSITLETARVELAQSSVTQPIAFAFGLRP